jgi:hypothetical protein
MLGIAAGAAMAVFAASRTKPPVIFAAGLGLALGVLLRFLADWMSVPRSRRAVLSVALISAAAFAASFGLGYRRAAIEWGQLHDAGPDNPLAAALLKSFPDADASDLVAGRQRFTVSDYLSRRLPSWPSPWPEVLCGAEWVLCIVIGGLCVSTPARRASRG